MKSLGCSRFSASIARIHGLDRPRRMRREGKEARHCEARSAIAAYGVRHARRIECAARLRFGERFFDGLVLVSGRVRNTHPRLLPSAVEVKSDGHRDIGERADREAQPQSRRAEPGIGAESEAETDRHQAYRKDDQRPDTAPFARTVPNRTIVTPNSRKLQVARSWMWRAIGSAGLCGRGTARAPACRPASAARPARR